MRLALLLRDRLRLRWAKIILWGALALRNHGERVLTALERELGLEPRKPFRWADYRPEAGK